MPLVECGIPNAQGRPHPDALVLVGPTLFVNVGFDPAFVTGGQTGVPKPARTDIQGLIDTGATQSCIDQQLADEIGLPIVDRQTIAGVGSQHVVPLYLAQVHVSAFTWTIHGAFHGVGLSEGGQPHRVLLGRLMLRDFIMIYDGYRGQVTLAR